MSTTPMATTPSLAEIWNNILNGDVAKDDPLWKEYLEKAAVFDATMLDEWNKIVDVLLVYVALFISVVTSFIIQTFTQFQSNPVYITNDLLIKIYNQLAAQYNNTSMPPIDPEPYYYIKDPDDVAIIQNTLLYTSLSLSIMVSVIALVAKLWLVSYSRQTSSVGSPYERAMKRQEAYNGVLVWNLGGVINMLPVILLIALFLFEIYVFTSVIQSSIGLTVGAILNVNVLFLGFTSLGGAFIPGCPFRSAFSSVIRFIFKKLQTFSKHTLCRCLPVKYSRRSIVFLTCSLLLASSGMVLLFIPYDTFANGSWLLLILAPASISIAYAAQQEADHKPQKYKISHLALWWFLSISVLTIIAVSLGDVVGLVIPALHFIIQFGVIGVCWIMIVKISKSMVDTGEIDAISWLLTTTPPQYPAKSFKKAAQMTGDGSIGCHYRPRLLESLMPFLTFLITSHHTPEHLGSDTHSPSSNLSIDDSEDPHLKNLETYIACWARLSEFTDCKGNFWILREDAKRHPKLEQPLIKRLVVLADPRNRFQVGLRSTANKVLNNFELDMEGNPLKSPSTVVWSVAAVLRSINVRGLTRNSQEEQELPNLHRPMELATRVEPPHSIGEA